MGPEVAARAVVRHRLGLLPYRRAGVLLPVLGKPYGEALTGRRDRAEIRRRRRQLFRLVFRPPLSDQSAAIQRNAQGPWWRRRMPRDEPARPRAARAGRGASRPGSPSYRQAPALKRALAAIDGAADDHRARAESLSRRSRDRRQRPAPAAGAAALPARRLAARGVRHQLPPLFRHQRAGRASRRGRRDVSRHACAGGAADRGRTNCRACGSTTSTACSTRRNTPGGCSN